MVFWRAWCSKKQFRVWRGLSFPRISAELAAATASHEEKKVCERAPEAGGVALSTDVCLTSTSCLPHEESSRVYIVPKREAKVHPQRHRHPAVRPMQSSWASRPVRVPSTRHIRHPSSPKAAATGFDDWLDAAVCVPERGTAASIPPHRRAERHQSHQCRKL
jgi:hypothetical protein